MQDMESELLGLKHRLERLTKQRDQAQWELEKLHVELQDKYGVGTLEDAEELAANLERESQEIRAELETGIADIRHVYSGLLRLAHD